MVAWNEEKMIYNKATQYCTKVSSAEKYNLS